MSAQHPAGGPAAVDGPVEGPVDVALEADIVAQRERLADTVDQLAHKLDVKAQARERAAGLKDRATTDAGRPRPALVAVSAGLVAGLAAALWARSWRARGRHGGRRR